tara:strand:- start:672 stop:800 length:129 start_codon:yes stop_codon:yes gene_type:complete
MLEFDRNPFFFSAILVGIANATQEGVLLFYPVWRSLVSERPL